MGIFASKDISVDPNKLKFIRTIDLKNHLQTLNSSPQGVAFLQEIPTSSNYFISKELTWEGFIRIINYCGDHHHTSNTPVQDHCDIRWLTSSCVLGFTPSVVEKYSEFLKPEFLKSYQEVTEHLKNMNRMIYS